ncbi:hypothetical protein CC80DRAFT_554917 [Byssothecium circinans]|uniref:Nephrocystin 3-like N-terminal domain-containing protein n=1 Tax=Byssothecium circinans TaxID=147558 RepID=A0A6A5TB59_9PLEO|nr:hypothetical protein CC80DRAFT_554917 [Byssothecium circinans]
MPEENPDVDIPNKSLEDEQPQEEEGIVIDEEFMKQFKEMLRKERQMVLQVRAQLLDLVRASQENAMLLHQLEESHGLLQQTLQISTRKPPVRIPRVLDVLALLGATAFHGSSVNIAALPSIFQHATHELRQVLTYRTGRDPKHISQVQFLLHTPRYNEWIQGARSDMIIVEARIRGGALDKISAASIFCATLTMSLLDVQPDALVVHFFCGMHKRLFDRQEDPWNGPDGMIRSLALQVLIQSGLVGRLNLQLFQETNLQEPNITELCDTLLYSLERLPVDTMVYIIVDGISRFASGHFKEDLEIVLELFHLLIGDSAPRVKILLTVPGMCTLFLKDQFVREQIVTLSPRNALQAGVS